jgi:hypothetical protein
VVRLGQKENAGRKGRAQSQLFKARMHPMVDPKLQDVANPENSTTADFDPYAPENLLLDMSKLEGVGVKKPLTTIPLKLPGKQAWFRTRPGEEWRGNFAIIDLKDDREQYVVPPRLLPELSTEVVYKTLQLAITRSGNLFLLPLRFPGPDGRDMAWWSSMREHAQRAETHWVRVIPNQELGAYERLEAGDKIPDPEWPTEHNFWGLVRIAFQHFLIEDLSHPVVRKLRGLA